MKRFASIIMVHLAALCVMAQRTTALDEEAWQASEWISVKDAPMIVGRTPDDRAADGASWFVAELKNEREVINAKWMTTGLGVYELYVNGKAVGEEILKPGFTHYAKTKRSFTYDVTALFRKNRGASNQLAAQVTPGWWADKIITPGGYNGMIGGKPAFRSVLQLTFADGSKQFFGTDCKHWKSGIAGPVKHAAIFDGETYDARIQPGYADTSILKEPEVSTAFAGEILPSDGAEVYLRNDLTMKPVKAYVWEGVTGAKTSDKQEEVEHGKIVVKHEYGGDGTIRLNVGETLVVDFGQNCAALPAFEFKAKAGTVLTCLPSEILNDGNGAESRGMDGPEGSVHRRNLRMHEKGIRIDYTFADTKDYVKYQPRYTFFGYRYLSITTTSEVSIKSIKSVPVSSITKAMESGSLTTGNDLINRLISNTLWGQRSNYLSVPTDCPQRNERLGWTADTQVFSETGSFFADTHRFFHKWMRDMRDSQSKQGGFPGVAPSGQYGSGSREMMRLGWADAGVIVPWTVWKQFGDIGIIDENWEAMDRFMQHVNSTRYDHQALVAENDNYQWADWLSYEPLESWGGGAFGKNGPLPDAVTYWKFLGASYWAIDAAMMRDMAAATGRDATTYQQMVDSAKKYLKEQFLDGKGSFKTAIFNTMQTPALFVLKNQLVEGEAKDSLIARLRQNFAEHGNCLQTGFLGTSILMPTLTDNGMVDIAYELLFQRKNPSWLYSIDNGATTIWERWNSYMIEKGMGPKGMNSFNHYAYGCVCQWLWENVAGICADTSRPGFKHIVMKPLPDRRLGFVNAEYQSAAGLIKSSWKYEGDLWIWDFTIPEGSTATVTLPGETESREYEGGSYHVTKNVQHRRTPIMGWSSWNTYRVNISDSLIKRQADAIVSTGLKDAGYTYINIDDGFFGYRDEKGEMHPHPQRFPGGMKAVSDYIHSKGLKAGIYSDAGAVTCGSIWDKDKNGIGAGLYGHEEQDARLYFRDWGYDFIKIDYCGAGQELDLDEQERYTTIWRAIQQTGRDDVEINICRWAFPGTWAKDLAASWRISGDIRDRWSSVKGIIEKNMPLSAYCQGGHFNDMDMLEIGRSLTDSEERVHFGLWCMMSSPLLIGCDMTGIRESSLALLKNSKLIALNQDTLALQAYPVQHNDGTYVLVKDIVKLRGNTRAVALYNPTDTAKRIAVALADLELSGRTTLQDLFDNKAKKRKNIKVTDSIAFVVPPHDVMIFRAEAERRLEPTRYESEWAYLPLYNDLGKRKKEICYAYEPKASGGMVVRYGGGRRENSILWNNVWSDQGGDYEMTVFYTPEDNRSFVVYVNGQLTNGRHISLRPGFNRVEMTSSTTWMPDIDKFELRRLIK